MNVILICKDRITDEIVEMQFASMKQANLFKKNALVFWNRFYFFNEHKLK